jgi:hypothetical protein
MVDLSYAGIVSHFARLNAEAVAAGEEDDVVPFSDVEYYANAILVEFEELADCPTAEEAIKIAERMAAGE